MVSQYARFSDDGPLWEDIRYQRFKGITPKVSGWRRNYWHPYYRRLEARQIVDRLERALALYGRGMSTKPGLLAPDSSLSRRASKCAYTNPFTLFYLHPIFMQALAPVTEEFELRKITILHHRWITTVRQLKFDADKIRNRVRQALHNFDGLFTIEFAIERGQRQAQEDWIVRFHVEGLIWGRRPFDWLNETVRSTFRSGYSGIPSIVLKQVHELSGVVAYMLKDPFGLYFKYPGERDSIVRGVCNQPYRVMARVWERFGHTDRMDMLFAVNGGKKVLKAVLAEIE